MIKISIKKTTNGEYKSFSCVGHAGFAKTGKDIVCAAVSMLVINTINSMEQLVKEDMEVTADEETGYINCQFRGILSEQGILLMDSMILGLSGAYEQYGNKYLILKFEEV